MDIEVLYEDAQFVAVNKRAQLPVHATVDPLRPNLQGLVEKARGEKLVLFHRLDVDTTGVVLFGRDRQINRAMTEAFRDREIDKRYWAVVDGRWLTEWKKVESFIFKGTGGRWQSSPHGGKRGLKAETEFSVLASNGERSFLEAHLLTGRTHQIRLHAVSLGHPILGDRLYGRAHPRGVPMALHARRLSFTHPLTQKPVTIEAPAPDYWEEVWLRGLR